MFCLFFFFFKQKTAYEMRISDWSSDVCSSDLQAYILFDAGHRALQVGLWENGKLGIHSTPGSAIAPPAKIRSLLDRSPPTDATAAPGQPWEIVPVDGRAPMALATAAASPAIKYVSVFCDGSPPRLAMLLNRTPARSEEPTSELQSL